MKDRRLLKWPGHPELPPNVSPFPIGYAVLFHRAHLLKQLTMWRWKLDLTKSDDSLNSLAWRYSFAYRPRRWFCQCYLISPNHISPNPLVTLWRHGSLGVSGCVSTTALMRLSINPRDCTTPREGLRNQQLHPIERGGAWRQDSWVTGNNFELLVLDDGQAKALSSSCRNRNASDRDEKLNEHDARSWEDWTRDPRQFSLVYQSQSTRTREFLCKTWA